MEKKKALSPLIVTVLLVMIGFALASTIFVWANGFIKEGLQKFEEPVDRSCENLLLDLSISGDKLMIINKGTIPVYKLGYLISGAGSSEIEYVTEENFNVGLSRTVTISSGEKVERIIPVLLASNKEGVSSEYQCPDQYWLAPNRD